MSYCLWKNYQSKAGNTDYRLRYYDDYLEENCVFFRYLLEKRLAGMSEVNIAIIGGGNGWELTAINEILEKTGLDIDVSCTVVDNYKWPINEIDSNRGRNIKDIVFVKKDMFDFLMDEDNISRFDLLYFSRCINYTDLHECGYLNRCTWDGNSQEIFAILKDVLSEQHILTAFAQIELGKQGYTMDVNNNFKRIFGFGEGLRIKCPASRTSLYLWSGGDVTVPQEGNFAS